MIEETDWPKYEDSKIYLPYGSHFNFIREFVLKCRARAGANCKERTDGTNGTYISAQIGGIGTANDFTLYDAGGGKLGVKNGTVNSGLPTGMTAGGAPAYTVAVTGSGYAYLDVTVDGSGTITSRAIGHAASVPSNTTTHGYKSLGDYTNTSGVIAIGSGTQGIGSQNYMYCSGTNHVFWS